MHSYDLAYIFGKVLLTELEPDSNDLKLQSKYVDAIANFVKSGYG